MTIAPFDHPIEKLLIKGIGHLEDLKGKRSYSQEELRHFKGLTRVLKEIGDYYKYQDGEGPAKLDHFPGETIEEKRFHVAAHQRGQIQLALGRMDKKMDEAVLMMQGIINGDE